MWAFLYILTNIRSHACFVQMKVAHSSRQRVISGFICFVHPGFPKFMSRILSTWNQSRALSVYRRVAGSYFALFARSEKARVFNVANNPVSVHSMSHAHAKLDCT